MRTTLGAFLIVLALAGSASEAHALCAAGSDSLRSVDVAFEGVALPGPVSPDGTLLSPARFEVTEWLKGSGPAQVEVPTAVSGDPDGEIFSMVSVGINPTPGERWLVMLRDGSPSCTGSRLLDDSGTIHDEESTSASFPRPLAGLLAAIAAAGVAAVARVRRSRRSSLTLAPAMEDRQ